MPAQPEFLESQTWPLQSNGLKVCALSRRLQPAHACSSPLVSWHHHATSVGSALLIPQLRTLPWEAITIRPTRHAQGSRAMRTVLSSTTCNSTSAGTPPSSTRCSCPSRTSTRCRLRLRCPFYMRSRKPRRLFVIQLSCMTPSSTRWQHGQVLCPSFRPHPQQTLCCNRLQGRGHWLSCLPPKRLPVILLHLLLTNIRRERSSESGGDATAGGGGLCFLGDMSDTVFWPACARRESNRPYVQATLKPMRCLHHLSC